MRVHQVRIDFNVTEEIVRYVYVYIVEAQNCYLIDSGVYGCQEIICNKLRQIGRKLTDIKAVFLTHAHPDHIGTAAWFQEKTGCRIYAGAGEKRWIEDIDLQFKERPIPNFYKLAGKSSKVDIVVKDGDNIIPEDNLTVKIAGTPGHSAGEVSYIIGDAAFIGDSVPVKGDIPIYISAEDTLRSLDKIAEFKDVNYYYPAWDKTYSKIEMQNKLKDAYEIVETIGKIVTEVGKDMNMPELVDYVCTKMNMPFLKTNPLFGRTVASYNS